MFFHQTVSRWLFYVGSCHSAIERTCGDGKGVGLAHRFYVWNRNSQPGCSTPFDTIRHHSTPFDTIRHHSTPFDTHSSVQNKTSAHMSVCKDHLSKRIKNKTCENEAVAHIDRLGRTVVMCDVHYHQLLVRRQKDVQAHKKRALGGNTSQNPPAVPDTIPTPSHCNVLQLSDDCLQKLDTHLLEKLIREHAADPHKSVSIGGERREIYAKHISPELSQLLMPMIEESAQSIAMQHPNVEFHAPSNISILFSSGAVPGQYPHIDLRPGEVQGTLFLQNGVPATLVSRNPKCVDLGNKMQRAQLLGTDANDKWIVDMVVDYADALNTLGGHILEEAVPQDQVRVGTLIALQGGVVHAGPPVSEGTVR